MAWLRRLVEKVREPFSFHLLDFGRNRWDGTWWLTIFRIQSYEGVDYPLLSFGYDGDTYESWFTLAFRAVHITKSLTDEEE